MTFDELKNNLLKSKYYYFHTKNGILLKGDCLEILNILPDNFFDVLLTDPPYNISRNMEKKPKFKKKPISYYYGNWDVWENEEDFKKWIYKWLDLNLKKMKVGSWIYIFFGLQKVHYFLNFKNLIFRNYLIYWKTNAYSFFHLKWNNTIEMIFVGNKEKRSNLKRKPKNLHELDNIIKTNVNHVTKHPTEKNLNAIKKILYYTTLENDIVIDPFAGSGTTLLASEELNLKWIGIEKEEEYCEIIKERLKKSKVKNFRKMF